MAWLLEPIGSRLFTTGKQTAWQPVEVVAGLGGRRGLGIGYGLPSMCGLGCVPLLKWQRVY